MVRPNSGVTMTAHVQKAIAVCGGCLPICMIYARAQFTSTLNAPVGTSSQPSFRTIVVLVQLPKRKKLGPEVALHFIVQTIALEIGPPEVV